MKTTIISLLLTGAVWSGMGFAAEDLPVIREGDVQQGLESIVSNCEKKQLPAEQEIECIEQGYLQFMGEPAAGDS